MNALKNILLSDLENLSGSIVKSLVTTQLIRDNLRALVFGKNKDVRKIKNTT